MNAFFVDSSGEIIYVYKILKLLWNVDSGKVSAVWYGSTPVVLVASPDLVKEVFTNKFGQFLKSPPPPSLRPLVTGTITYDGEKWAAHRKILNPAFHFEQIKVRSICSSFCFLCT